METEVSSTVNEESNKFKNNVNIVQSTNKEISCKNSNIELQNNESSESSSNETKITNNKSGASPKLVEENNLLKDTSPGDCQYFFEDEVFRIDKKGRVKFGLVLETPGTYSGDEDDEFDVILDKDEIRVVWYPEFKESIQTENSIGLADRSLIPGDVVRKNGSQRGYCRDINMKADVKILGTKYVIKNVNAERLRVILNWQSDGAVCLDSWVGSIKDVEEKAILRTASGCRIEISSNDFYNFQDLNARRQRDVYNPKVFYPGNTIIGSLPPMENIKILTPDIPLHTNKKGKPLSRKFTIESVYTDCVWINWQCKALSDETSLEDITLQPNPCVRGDDLKRLKRLNLFESCMLQIVDRNYLTYSACDTIVKKSDWDKEQSIKFREILKQQKEVNSTNFARTFTSTSGTPGTQHHHEKFKKKLSLSLDDKSGNKLKRSLLKGDKLTKREDSQDMFAQEKTTPRSINDCDAEWFSTDDEDNEEIDGDNCDVVAIDIANFVENLKQYTEDCVSTTTTMSTCSSPSPHTSPKHLTKRQLKKKTRKIFKNPLLTDPSVKYKPMEGDELVTEALLVYSTATVVWQDGTIESNIPSTQLYPIHHLDNHEFFPGDFVISVKEEQDFNHRDYGVIQTVDHDGRIAHVKWFTTYTSTDELKPTYKGETECSVYDLKDQPDFPYRPGTMVIRVANFLGEDAKCSAGQVIDNCIDGRVKVWWADGHISLCWPQDLFEVGQLDQGDFSHASEDSWETESENSEVGCGGGNSLNLSIPESDILTRIEKARAALARLQDIFNIDPNLQNPEVMRRLLGVYKACRCLDRLLNTNFFHEDHFMGLIERVRKVGPQSMHERAQDQKNRLFSDNLHSTSRSPHKHQQHQDQYSAVVLSVARAGNTNTCSASGTAANVHKCHQSLSQQLQNTSAGRLTSTSKDYAPRVLFTISSTPVKCPNSHNHISNSGVHLTTPSSLKKRNYTAAGLTSVKEKQPKITDDVPKSTISNANATTTDTSDCVLDIAKSPSSEQLFAKNPLLNSVMMNNEKAFGKTSLLTATSQDDSGNYSRNENYDGGSSNSCTSSSEQKSINQSNTSIELTEEVTEFMACARLCESSLKKRNYTAAGLTSVKEKQPKITDDVPKSTISNANATATDTSDCVLDIAKSPSFEGLFAKNRLLNSVMMNIEKAFGKTNFLTATSQDDSGNYSRNENYAGGSSNSCTSSSEQKLINQSNTSIELTEEVTEFMACARLCELLKDQLVKCVIEISEKYYKDDQEMLSDIKKIDLKHHKDENIETVTDIGDSEVAVKVLKNYKNVNESEEAVATLLTKSEAVSTNSTSLAKINQAEEVDHNVINVKPECFQVLSNAPINHKYQLTIFHPNNPQQYYRAVQREQRLLKTSLPPGVYVKIYEDRMDLLSVMIEGPKRTPYEDGMFFFDIQLSRDYPKSPPVCHYISFCSDRLNPNLYADGKVCVSLLGTWMGKDTEMWSSNSTLLQVIVSIQGLILVPEPYFNEAGYEKQKGTQQGKENSRMYNEMAIIKLVQSTTKLLQNPPEIFRDEIHTHFKQNGLKMYERIKGWMELSQQSYSNIKESLNHNTENIANEEVEQYSLPDFPLVPASRGFCLTLTGLLENFKQRLTSLNEVSTASRQTESATNPKITYE